jgi:mannan polymerase II complex MNN11 subunit
MHFAMPPRKTSRPPPYAARNQNQWPIPPALRNLLRRDKLRMIVVGILGFLTIFWLAGRIRGGEKGAGIPKVAIGSGPPVVIVTVIDPKADAVWVKRIKANREEYAKRHGPYTPAIIYERLDGTGLTCTQAT